MIQKITPSFTSKVYIANYNEMNKDQKRLIASPHSLTEIRKLEKNKNNDIVVISPETDSRLNGLFMMSVTEKHGNSKIYSTSDYIQDIRNISKQYTEMKNYLNENKEHCSTATGTIAKYII